MCGTAPTDFVFVGHHPTSHRGDRFVWEAAVSRRPRTGAGSRSDQSVGWSSAIARREADLFFADLIGSVAPRLIESVETERPSTGSREADLFWIDLLGRRSARPWQPSDPSFPRHRPTTWKESDDDGSSIPAETFGSDRVRISLRNDDGTPAAGIAFRAVFRDGHVVNGTLDARGEATISDRTHGDVQVTFPALPAASWEISSFGGSGG